MKQLATPSQSRIQSIDILRGIIIMIMGLDHIRDFIVPVPLGLEDYTQSPALFFTRWISHYCAPIFVMLAGTSAFIYGQKVGRDALRKFLWSRGIWLIFIELIVVHYAWTFDFDFWILQVIWAIGVCMILLGVLIYLPRWALIVFTAILILGHNALDGMHFNSLGWSLLHEQDWGYQMGDTFLMVVYPLIPWPAVMTLGYLIGSLFLGPQYKRKEKLVIYGSLIILVFVVVRLINQYGDVNTWTTSEKGAIYTLIDFLDTTKYPPSLLYLAMTIGPALLLLPILEKWKGFVPKVLMTFGRVPFFYYIVHLYIGHLMGIAYNGIVYGKWGILTFEPQDSWPNDYQMNLFVAYLAWAVLTIIMYFLCKWFVAIKKQRNEWWLKYL